MAKFGAHSVSSIEYDFSKWNGPKGSVPEPSDAAIKQFFKAVKEAASKLDDVNATEIEDNPEAVSGMLESLNEDSLFEIADDIADAIGEMSNGQPSSGQVKALPFRVKQAFFGFLMGEIQAPEGSSGGTTTSLRAVRSG